MKKPLLQDDAFLADVAACRDDHSHALNLWWLGQSGFLMQCHGRHVLFDPYLSDSLTNKYAGTDKPHVRISERIVAPERLDFIDVITSTHGHTDHLDGETLAPIINAARNRFEWRRETQFAPDLVLAAASQDLAAERLASCAPWLEPINGWEVERVRGFTF